MIIGEVIGWVEVSTGARFGVFKDALRVLEPPIFARKIGFPEVPLPHLARTLTQLPGRFSVKVS